MTACADPDEVPPSHWQHVHELAWMAARVWRSFAHLGPRGPEGGEPAMVIPGFLASDRTTTALRMELAKGGWRVHGWGLGLNRGAHADTVRHLRQRLEAIHDGRPVLLVGWSLGGVYARELAREVPEMVRAVITLGSPFSGDPRLNNVWPLYEKVAGHKVDEPPVQRLHAQPPVPCLAIWSRKDGIVAPRAAYGLDGERDEAVELRCAHMAFGISRRTGAQAVRAVAAFLRDHPVAPPAVAERSAGRR